MSARELILLSPYRLPTQNTLYLGDEEVAAFLNGYTALWHPAALHGAAGLPRLGSPYDHEQPLAGHLYAVPDNPPLILPDDWEERVRAAGALSFKANADRPTTLNNLREALRGWSAEPATPPSLLELDDAQAAPFFGVGFGLMHVEALFEAMSHENLLAVGELWQEVSAAVAALSGEDAEAPRRHLQAAADRLLSAREVLYPVTLHLLGLWLVEADQLGGPWPAALDRGLPLSVLACGALLERLGREHPQRLATLREGVAGDLVEVCGGVYEEREDPLLPLESQLWNLRKGLAVTQELTGQEVRVFARRRFGFSPSLPMLLQNFGVGRALLVAFDEGVLPAHRSPAISWASADGKQVDAFTRTPQSADSPQTYFHLAYHLHQTIMQDQVATFPLLQRGKPAGPWLDDWLELSRLAPVLGRWTTLSGFFNEVLPGDYAAPSEADEFHGDYLVERVPEAESGYSTAERPRPVPATQHPISMFAHHVRARRRLDTAWTLAALHRSLGGQLPEVEGAPFLDHLAQLEDRLESAEDASGEALNAAQARVAEALAGRLVARGQANQPGYLVLNPCSFKRRVALELPDVAAPLPVADPLKACQVDGGVARLVVEVPALGFAWFPKSGATAAPPRRLRLADERCVRNEFFEAEVDPQTGGLRAIRDQRLRVSRLGQQLVFNPGSTMRVKQVQTTSTGPALGEIISEGAILDTQQEVIATFRQRFRAWLGRPVLDLRIEIFPTRPPEGYPWHSYYGARFAWRDERATLLRGVNGAAAITSHTRPESPDFLEVRLGQQNTVIFPGGLPFQQRHGGRMLDVLLVCPGETAQAFDLAIGLDRDYPMQTALGMVTPAPVVPTLQGPPHVGAEGWLFHLDAPNLMLTSLRPAQDGTGGILARLLECGGFGGPAEFRCVRDPQRAMLLDGRGTLLMDVPTQGDAVILDVGRNDLVQLRVDFS
jgi:hypothetical protein